VTSPARSQYGTNVNLEDNVSSNWTIGRKLFTAIGVLSVVILISGVSSWYNEQQSGDRFQTAIDRAKKIRGVAKMKRLAFELYGGEKILILSGYDNDKKNFDTWAEKNRVATTEFDKTVAELKPMFTDPADQALLDKSVSIVAELDKNGEQVKKLVEEGKYHDAQTASREKNRALVDENNAVIDRILNGQEAKLAAADAEGDAAAKRATFIISMVLLVSMFVAGVVVWVVRQISKALTETATEMRQSAEQVVAASAQVSSSAQSLSQGATEQAASLEETSASMEEMASMTRKNAQNSQTAAGLVVETEQAVHQSNAALSDMVEAMSGIRDSSTKISKIIKTIDEIAFQTNILALNAAVEAARAGEAGMGFAVVADEVRNLAQRSAQAAKDTASLIEDAIARSQQGTDKVAQMGVVIATITEKATKVRGLVQEISTASSEQTQGIEQVTQSVSQMEQVTQTTAATAEESAAASEELNAQAETSMVAVSKLEAMVGGGTRASATPKAYRASAHAGGGKVVKMAPVARKVAPPVKAEEAIPFDDAGTGTFGKF